MKVTRPKQPSSKNKKTEKRLLSRGLKKIGASDVYGTVILRVAQELSLSPREGFCQQPDAKTAIDAFRGVVLPEGFEEDAEEYLFSRSYPTLTTRYLIHVARVEVRDVPVADHFKLGGKEFTWVDPHLVDNLQQKSFEKQRLEYLQALSRLGGAGNYAKETEQLRKSTSAYVWRVQTPFAEHRLHTLSALACS